MNSNVFAALFPGWNKPLIPGREVWLHGWPRSGHVVIIGALAFCAGCGAGKGVAPFDLSDTPIITTGVPEWPFDMESCPLCHSHKELTDMVQAVYLIRG